VINKEKLIKDGVNACVERVCSALKALESNVARCMSIVMIYSPLLSFIFPKMTRGPRTLAFTS
jgi:hypothetical protein